jgi:hypothetical protein
MPRLATVDERYESYNVEMAEVIGGSFWKPYGKSGSTSAKPSALAGSASFEIGGPDPSLFQARPPIELTNARLRQLAAALGPAYVRVSGTWANTVYFHDSDSPPPATPPAGFKGVLTRAEWKGVVDFAHAVDAKIVSSFAIGPGVRDSTGAWTPDQAKAVVAYTRSVGGSIAAAELFNEPTIAAAGGAPPGYSAKDFARDEAVFRTFASAIDPEMRIVGPGSVGEAIAVVPPGMGMLHTSDFFASAPSPRFDVFSYHHYGAVSQRCAAMGPGMGTTVGAALSEEWLASTDVVLAFYEPFHDRYAPRAPIWLTETGDAACGGNPWATTFLDSFRYLDQLGRLARRGVGAVFHNTLASSEYGLLEQSTFAPRPNYWAALLWRRLMGTTVLDAGASPKNLHLYAQCARATPGAVTMLAINPSLTETAHLDVPLPARRYTLSAQTVDAGPVQLNGKTLALGPNDALPSVEGADAPPGRSDFAPATITFLLIEGTGNAACK